jgi:hypothetical protein
MDRVIPPAPARPTPAGPQTQTLPVLVAPPGATAAPEPPQDLWHRAAPVVREWLAALPGDPRLPLWIRRAAAAAIAGGILAVVAGWQAGILAAALTAGAEALYTARTSMVVPASVRAMSARRRTTRRLARLAPAGYLTLRGRLVPGTGSVVEHLVAGPGGVYAVLSQRWDRRLPARASHTGHLFHGPFDHSGVLVTARDQAGQVSARVSEALGLPVAVRPAVVIYGPPLPWAVMRIAGVDVVDGRRLRRFLRREQKSTRLTERQIELIHAAAAQALPPAW